VRIQKTYPSPAGSDACKSAQSRSFDSLRSLRISAGGSRSALPRSRLLIASNKTGAYSPPRFSAPALKVSWETGEPGRSSTFGQLVCRAGADAKRPEYKRLNPRCPAAARRVNNKAGRGIYLVDNKQGGIEWAELMYTVPNWNIAGFLKLFLNFPQAGKLLGAATHWGPRGTSINFLP